LSNSVPTYTKIIHKNNTNNTIQKTFDFGINRPRRQYDNDYCCVIRHVQGDLNLRTHNFYRQKHIRGLRDFNRLKKSSINT